jgi:hypothetical protein
MMSISGNWVGHYSWGCTTNYSQFNITFNANGTFTGTNTGNWVQQDGTVLLKFTGGPAIYGGILNGNVGSGAMSTFAGLNGCWYLTKAGTVGVVGAAAHALHQTHDAAGNKV